MRLKELRIDGFGKFSDVTFGPLDAPVVVFYGPNEAGKSTILNFVRTILFGFPTQRRDEHYPPNAGGKHGGRIVLTGGDAIDYVVERYVGAKGGPVAVSGIDGKPFTEAKLRELTGHASKDVFENIFAFSLDELQSSDILKNENVNTQIYSAGMGVTNLPGLMAGLEKRMIEIYRPAGSAPLLNKIAADLENVESQIRDITKHSEQYSQLKGQSDKAKEEAAEFQEMRRELTRRKVRLTKMTDSWDSYVELVDTEQAIKQLPDYPGLPVNPIGELEKRESVFETAQKELDAAQTELKGAQIEAESITPDKAILGDEELITGINQRKSSFQNSVKDLPERKAEFGSLFKTVDRTINSLGEGWDRDRLRNTDLESIPVTVEIEAHKHAHSSQGERIIAQESSLETLRSSLKQKESQGEGAQSELAKAQAPESDQNSIDHRRKLIGNARDRLVEHRYAEDALTMIEDNAGSEASSISRTPILFAASLMGVMGVLAIVAGLLMGELLVASLFALVLFIGAGATFLIGMNRAVSAGAKSQSSDVAGTRKLRLKEMEAGLADISDELQVDILDGEKLIETEEECDSDQAVLDGWINLNESAQAAKKLVDDEAELVSASEKTLDESRQKLRTIEDTWKEWLFDKDLPESLTPLVMDNYRGLITTGKKELESADTMARRIEAIETDIEEYSVLVTPVADRHGESPEANNNVSLSAAAESLIKKLETAKDMESRKAQRLVDVEKAKADYENRDDQVATARKTLSQSLNDAGVDTVDGYRARAELQAQRKRKESRIGELEQILQSHSGPGDVYEAFREELLKTLSGDIESELLEVDERLIELQSKNDGMVADYTEADTLIAQLIDEDNLSSLQLEKRRLEEELKEKAGQWTKLRLSLELLRRARDRFQQERQPGVIKHSEAFMSDVTGGRYKSLYSPIGEQTLTITEASRAQKSPDQLSRGTREQLFLSLRFGLIKEYNEHSAALPVIVDEVLVNFDPDRAKRSCSAFANLSETNQVIVFTCHPEMVDLFKTESDECQVIDISSGS